MSTEIQEYYTQRAKELIDANLALVDNGDGLEITDVVYEALVRLVATLLLEGRR